MAVKVTTESTKHATITVDGPGSEGGLEDVGCKRVGTAQDRQDMWRVGRAQELNVSLLTN